MPTGRDADLVHGMLTRVGIDCDIASSQVLAEALHVGAGALLIAEEALNETLLAQLDDVIRKQPVWSDLPIIVFSASTYSAENLLEALSGRFNATIVERPIRITRLVSAVRGALRARQRQYQARDLLLQLKQADQQKDLFLATLSHELRTPLNSIIGWIHILRQRSIGDPEIQHALDVIDRNARAQSEMISDILLVSRVITGKVELATETIDVMSVISASIDVVSPSADAKKIAINVDTKNYQPVSVEADPERLKQVILNLLTNAVKFTPEGGHIDIALAGDDANVTIEVTDNGYGIEPRFLPYIFERFRQADSKHTRRVGGLGLGLAIVSHLVELHGGTVTAHSEGKGKGATFMITLPIISSEMPLQSIPPGMVASKNGHGGQALAGLRILIVEDDADSRDMLETVLRFQGADVVTAKDVIEGFDVFRAEQPDVLISDVGLPELDGYDLIRRIRRLSEDQGGTTPAIALTGYVSLQDQSQALNAGYQEHLPKPVDTDNLIDTILKFQTPTNNKNPSTDLRSVSANKF
jgi:signal transduction histidine kinase/ActR/RegA family two-component response regulator